MSTPTAKEKKYENNLIVFNYTTNLFHRKQQSISSIHNLSTFKNISLLEMLDRVYDLFTFLDLSRWRYVGEKSIAIFQAMGENILRQT